MGTGDETVTALKTEVSPSPRNILKCLKCISSEENDTKLAVEIPNRGDQLRKCIVGIIAWRESCLDALLLDYPGLVRLAPTIESSTGKVLNQFLDKLRYLSIEIVEKTCEWRKLTGMEQAPLLFEGENYLLKMITDLDFCDQASDVRSPWWGSSMARNPFLLLDAASEPAPLLGVDPTSTTAVGGVDKLRVVNCTRVLESEQQRHGNLTNFPTSPWSNRGATNTDNSAFPISNYNGDDEPGQGPAMSPSSSLQPLTEPRKKSLQQPKPPLDLGGVEVQRRHKRGSAGKETVSGGQPRPRRTRQLIANGSRASNPRCSTTTKEHHPKRTKIKRNMSLSVGSAFPITPSDLYSNPQGSRPHPKGDRASLSTPTLASIHGDKTDTTLNSYRPQNGPRFPDPVVVSLGRVRSRSHLGAEPYRPLSLMDQPPPPLLSTSNSLDDPSQPSYFPLLQSTESDPPGGSGEGGGEREMEMEMEVEVEGVRGGGGEVGGGGGVHNGSEGQTNDSTWGVGGGGENATEALDNSPPPPSMEGRSDDRAQGGGGIWLDGQQQQQQEQQGQQEELSPPHTLESSVFFSTSSTTATSTSASASASASASTSTSASTSVSASASASSPSSVSFSFSVTNQRKKQRVEGGWGRVGLGGRGVKDRLESREDGYGHHLSLAAAKSMVSVSLSSSGVPREWMRGGILGKARLVESVQSEARRREAAMEAAAAKEYLRRERACMGAATHCISQLRVLDQLVWGERRRWARAVAARAAAAKMASNLHAILSEWSGIAHRRALAGRMRRRNAWRRVRVCYVEWYARGCLSREVVRLRKIYLLKHTFEPVWRRWQLYVRRNKIVRERYRYVVGRRAVAYFHHWRALGRVGGAVRRIQKQARLWLLLLPVKRARYKGSRKIQKAYRRWCVRRDYFAAVTIQALARGYIDREVVGRLGEERRGELEATTLEAALDEAVEEAQRWLKTKEGKHELRQLITRIKVRDATRKQERKDKGLSRAERRQEELIDTFQRYDVDGSQAINSDELSDMLRDLCVPLEEGQLEDILAAVDKDDSGEVELLEFLAWFNGEHSSENSNLDLATRTALQLATIKLKGMKFVHQVTGATLRKQAERIFIGRAIRTATEEARKEFREKYPPRRVCVICGTALPSSGALRHHLIHAQEEHAALAEAEERTKTNLMISD